MRRSSRITRDGECRCSRTCKISLASHARVRVAVERRELRTAETSRTTSRSTRPASAGTCPYLELRQEMFCRKVHRPRAASPNPGGGATDCTSTHAAIDIACGECEKEDVQDGKWCQQCGMILCALCASHHQRAKASRAHPLKALDTFLEEREQESLQRKLQVLQARTRSLQQEMRQLSLHQQVAAEEQVISVLATTLESCGRVADDAGTSAEDVIASRLMRAAQGASS